MGSQKQLTYEEKRVSPRNRLGLRLKWRRALLGKQRKGATSLKRTGTVLGSSSLLGLPIAIAGSRKIHLPSLSGLECLPCEPAGGLAAFPLPFACRSCPLLHPPAFLHQLTLTLHRAHLPVTHRQPLSQGIGCPFSLLPPSGRPCLLPVPSRDAHLSG